MYAVYIQIYTQRLYFRVRAATNIPELVNSSAPRGKSYKSSQVAFVFSDKFQSCAS